MCGRFTLTRKDPRQIALELGVDPDAFVDYRPRYNIAPTDQHWIVREKYEQRQLLPAKWGLVNSWAKDGKRAFAQINARRETLSKKSPFREAFQKRRCIVPADGFFEWTGPKDARRPIWYHRPDGGLIYFAGLHESWLPEPEHWERTFTIVTTDANGLIEPVHDRMPVVLTEDKVDAWLHPNESEIETLEALLEPPPDDLLVATPVSTKANSVKNDDPSVLEPAGTQPELL
jgi:putative SOS response-associated peptidase YedK